MQFCYYCLCYMFMFKPFTTIVMPQQLLEDPCSLATVSYFKALHLDWDVNVDFQAQTLTCIANQKFECICYGADKFILDSRDLIVESVKVDGEEVLCKVLSKVTPFGQPVEIQLNDEQRKKGSIFTVALKYSTSPKATAIQWLKPQQTLGKKLPYLFTQCQAIHARSLLPCQDSPSQKLTYNARITVPEEMVALMSAVKGEEIITSNGKKTCHFEQKIPIPSYLLAMAVGALEFRTVGPRSKVWCEAEMIDACEYEFAKVEEMLKAGESLMGPYVWGQYDLLILPPSFPYGGMENPCLTFATPTVIAGDRSLTGLVAHEITHSWTGNLVTNRTWEHFWLNEGFTRFLEGKIIGLLDGEPLRQFMAISGWNDLVGEIELFGATNPLTALTPTLKGIDPDDSFSSVPYEKGYAFLYYIESLVGGPSIFNPFLKSYIKHYEYKTVLTDDFKSYLHEYFKDKADKLKKIDWNAWLHSPGMPPVHVVDMYDTTLSSACQNLCDEWNNADPEHLEVFKEENYASFTTLQKIDFLTKLYQEDSISVAKLEKMIEVYKLFTYNVSEIQFSLLRMCVRAKLKEAYPKTIEFVLSQGRMKFVRPLYREMYKNEETRDMAIATFKENRNIYHSITANMVAKDLHLNE
ncbi:leukotriene A-4 hydrolase-like isoform X2 [Hydractinia symbiolongicarpus]|uniref:leukotriene A-4 hydrolase-like isoform X2 n=1 Tax=Hydractinia symbiolongicarpus TaxID=13093 RepID=UPI00254C47F7|nr:leukotriene A-4 hydrolase-like isoform X2 [Hydractinia symbiolongicarpus]